MSNQKTDALFFLKAKDALLFLLSDPIADSLSVRVCYLFECVFLKVVMKPHHPPYFYYVFFFLVIIYLSRYFILVDIYYIMT